MKIFIKGSGVITTHGDLRSTWSALENLQFPQYHTLPLAEINTLGSSYGSSQRLKVLLNLVYEQLPLLAKDTALVISTTKGAIDDLYTSTFPAEGQPWTIPQEINSELELEGTPSSISGACASGTIAIIHGAMKLLAGECSSVIIIGFDILSDFVIRGFSSLKALCSKECKPFDRYRDGLMLGEGAGWMLLTTEECTYNSTSTIFSLEKWGISCDATHITAPCRNGSGLINLLKQLFTDHATIPGGINGHGTGTVYNDAMELLAFKSFFNTIPPLCSIKGSIGHCLGAAGIIEASISLEALQHSTLPPTVGHATPEESALNCVSGNKNLPLSSSTVLSCNSGFGGINSGLLFAKSS